ncbi:hypothetical protein KF941_05015 [Paracoccus sp. pheM1]|nr:hypothetical protein [Paracoccus sp. pheM1]
MRVTQTSLYLAVFAAVLARATGDRAFRLTLPGFFRAPVMRGASRLVGDCTDILPLGLRVGPGAMRAGLARETGREIAEALSHQACPGVAVLREMSRGGQGVDSAPVVFTSGLDLDGAQRRLLSPRVGRLFGRLVWSVSQAPQVALDVQVAARVAGRALPEPAALRAFLRKRLPQSHLPDRILAVPALPLSANGKPDRRRARQIAAEPGPEPAAPRRTPGDAPADADELAGLILDAFREALGAPGMGPEDDFFGHGGHSPVATRIIGKLQAEYGIILHFIDIFRHPTARALADIATRSAPAAPMPAAGEDAAKAQAAPLSLAQQSLRKAYAAFGHGGIFNLPFALRFPTPVDETVFGLAFGDLIRRHPVLRSHFRERDGQPLQEVVPVERLGDYRGFWTSAEAGDASRRIEAGHVFDLARELPLRLRFFREGDEQVLSMLFHHIVLDEWSLNLLMDQLGHAYRRRAAGLAPEWPDQPPGFHRFATAQRAAQADRAHLDHWLDHLRGAPRARPILGDAPGGRDPQGGWTRIDLPAEIARGLSATARRNAASLFATAYAAIGVALGRLGGIGDLVIGTSASGRNDPAWFDTVGYFTTMTAHRLALGAQDTPAALIAQVRDRIARSLPHSEIPLDQVAEALTGHPVTQLDEMFEVFIQIHARNRMNGAIALMDGKSRRIPADRPGQGRDASWPAIRDRRGRGGRDRRPAHHDEPSRRPPRPGQDPADHCGGPGDAGPLCATPGRSAAGRRPGRPQWRGQRPAGMGLAGSYGGRGPATRPARRWRPRACRDG